MIFFVVFGWVFGINLVECVSSLMIELVLILVLWRLVSDVVLCFLLSLLLFFVSRSGMWVYLGVGILSVCCRVIWCVVELRRFELWIIWLIFIVVLLMIIVSW